MELMDRALQREILMKLAERYPRTVPAEEMNLEINGRTWNFNAMYLHEHGLIQAVIVRVMAGSRVTEARITAKGLDFLQDDGGLGAILGTVTVRFEADTLKALLAAKVEASALPPEQKSKILAGLKNLGADALKEVSKRLLDTALDQAPGALQTLRQLLDLQ